MREPFLQKPNDIRTLSNACVDLHNFMKQHGLEHRSTRWISTEFAQMRRMLDDHFVKLTGEHLEKFWPDEKIRFHFESAPKGRYKEFKNGQIALGPRPLLGEDEVENCATIYAYSGTYATLKGQRLIKIGYTAQNLRRYLASKRDEYDPQWLASMPGSESLEDKIHAQWECQLARRDEWYWPVSELRAWIQAEFELLAPDYDKIWDQARATHGPSLLLR
jgi:hypothetical protein